MRHATKARFLRWAVIATEAERSRLSAQSTIHGRPPPAMAGQFPFATEDMGMDPREQIRRLDALHKWLQEQLAAAVVARYEATVKGELTQAHKDQQTRIEEWSEALALTLDELRSGPEWRYECEECGVLIPPVPKGEGSAVCYSCAGAAAKADAQADEDRR